MSAPDSPDPWWLAPLPDAAQPGLTSARAATLLAQAGPNLPGEVHARSLLLEYLSRFRNPLVLILLAASAASALTGELLDFVMIGVIVLLSVTLDFWQEYHANAAAEVLRRSVSARTRLVRDGRPVDIEQAAVVPGDIALLSAGDLVPADARVLEADDFFVKQALLTGESYPIEKRCGVLPASATDLQDADNAVFMGTSVISGSARVLVVRTGATTAMGTIARGLQRTPPPTSFEVGTRRFGMLILRLSVTMVMFVLLVNTLSHKPLLESFLFAVALAVGLTPELLPMVVSVTLARGAMRMGAQGLIVKRMTAIQDLGSMTILCTDKTGTLTEAKMRLVHHLDASGGDSPRVLELAWLNSWFETGLKSPLDDAILEHGQLAAGAWTKIDELPFDFERRRVSVLIDNGTVRWLVVKGAPADIVALCTSYELDQGTRCAPLDAPARAALHACHDGLEAQGLRVLGVAWREVPRTQAHALVADEEALVLSGFAAFLDPPKEGAALALQELRELGVEIKVVTGDSELVTRHVCAQLKLPAAAVLTGSEVARMDDDVLATRARAANVFCRIDPAGKNRIILALRARGDVVGYLGDGINDAPSLQSADVGLSVDQAVDVAREAADMIMMKHELQVLRMGVLEGRRTFGNIMKYIMMGTSSNFGNMFSMAGASLFLPFLPMQPAQILLNNMLYDLSEIPIPMDQVDAEQLRRPKRLDMRFIERFMVVVGPVSSLFDFLTFYLMLSVFSAGDKLFQTGWFVESLCTQVLVIFVIRTRGNPFKSRPHPLLAAASLGVVAVAVLLPLTPAGAYVGLVPLPWLFYAMLGGLVLLYLLIVELVKQWFYRWSDRDAGRMRHRSVRA